MNITCPGCQQKFLCNVEKCVKEQCTSKLHYSTKMSGGFIAPWNYSTLHKNRNENEQKNGTTSSAKLY